MVQGSVLMKNRLKFTIPLIALAISSGVQASSCSADQKHPNGKPDNFDINKELKQFKTAGEAASRLPLGGRVAKMTLMPSMFYPNRKYDLKNNHNMRSSQEFGNWFYGAAAAAMGYSKQEALTIAAVVQRWQNYGYPNNTDYEDIGKLASTVLHALRTGEGDNKDDTAPISGGHSYTTDVYNNDPNAESNSDSCNKDSSGNNSNSSGGGSSGSSAGFGGGWSGGIFIGAQTCYGSCRRGYIVVKDLPRKK